MSVLINMCLMPGYFITLSIQTVVLYYLIKLLIVINLMGKFPFHFIVTSRKYDFF